MVHMYPVGGPTKPTVSPAERRVYAALESSLDDNYHVFHGTRWINARTGGYPREGEVDFVLVHPDYGIVLFEVKGGDIGRESRTGIWTSTDHAGHIHEIRDPFGQVSESVHQLVAYLENCIATRPYRGSYWLNGAVWFPDISWMPAAIQMPHIDDNLVLDSSALLDLKRVVGRLFTHVRRRPIAPDALTALIDALAPSRTIRAKLRDQFNSEDAEFIRLRDDQYRKLDMMKHHPRVTVRGAAGTGKTVIVLERARQLAADGLDVLFVCSNLSLAHWIGSMVAEEPREIRTHIEVYNIEALCAKIIKQAGFIPAHRQEVLNEELGDRIEQIDLSTQFLRSVRRLEAGDRLPQYDAIIVDEAQDIDRPLWVPLYRLLHDRRNGKFIACFDPAQREREGEDGWTPPIPNGSREIPLSENCRNTRAIFRTAQQFYRGIEPPSCIGPKGRDVEWVDPTGVAGATTADDRDGVALTHMLDDLIDREGIAPRDIIVVTCRSQKTSDLYRRSSIGNYVLTNHMDQHDPNVIRIVTIRSVKGLESSVVIIVEVDGLLKMRVSNPELYSKFMYIATSRAKNHLIVLSSSVDTLPLQPALSTTLLS